MFVWSSPKVLAKNSTCDLFISLVGVNTPEKTILALFKGQNSAISIHIIIAMHTIKTLYIDFFNIMTYSAICCSSKNTK